MFLLDFRLYQVGRGFNISEPGGGILLYISTLELCGAFCGIYTPTLYECVSGNRYIDPSGL